MQNIQLEDIIESINEVKEKMKDYKKSAIVIDEDLMGWLANELRVEDMERVTDPLFKSPLVQLMWLPVFSVPSQLVYHAAYAKLYETRIETISKPNEFWVRWTMNPWKYDKIICIYKNGLNWKISLTWLNREKIKNNIVSSYRRAGKDYFKIATVKNF